MATKNARVIPNLTTFLTMVRAAVSMENEQARDEATYNPVSGLWYNDSGVWVLTNFDGDENAALTALDAGEDRYGNWVNLYDNGNVVLPPKGLGEYLDNLAGYAPLDDDGTLPVGDVLPEPDYVLEDNKCRNSNATVDEPVDFDAGSVPVDTTTKSNNAKEATMDNTTNNNPNKLMEDSTFRELISLTNLDGLTKKEMLEYREYVTVALSEYGKTVSIRWVGVTNERLANSIVGACKVLKRLHKGHKKQARKQGFTRHLKVVDVTSTEKTVHVLPEHKAVMALRLLERRQAEINAEVLALEEDKDENQEAIDILLDEYEANMDKYRDMTGMEEEASKSCTARAMQLVEKIREKVGNIVDVCREKEAECVNDLCRGLFGLDPMATAAMWDEAVKSKKATSLGRAKAGGWTSLPVLSVWNPKTGNVNATRLWTSITVGPVGMIQRKYGKQYPLPIIQVLNNQRTNSAGRTPELPVKFREACYQSGYTLCKGKWLIRNEIMEEMRRTLPKDLDVRGYINGLCAPMIHSGDYSVTFRNRTAQVLKIVRGSYKLVDIPAECDGAGGIHSKHQLWDDMGVAPGKRRWLQVRMWNPETGVFAKGLLVADDRCLDSDDNPDMWVDWMMAKGAHKELAKQRAKEWGQKSMTLMVGVMRSFETLQKQYANAQILQFWENSEANRQRIQGWVKKFFEELSMEKLMESLKKSNDFIRRVILLDEACGMDPLTNVLVQEAINDKLMRKLYRVAQGAGLRGYCFGVVMDASLKPGECVCASRKIDGAVRYRVGDVVAYSRAPGINTGASTTMVVVAPKPHMLIEERGNLMVPQGVMYVSPFEAHQTQLDDDGDVIVVWYEADVVAAFQTRIALNGFGKAEDVYLIEPEKGGEDVIGGNLWGSEAWREFVSVSGKGAIGETTLAGQMWLALGHHGEFLATTLWLQAAVDEEKRARKPANPDMASDPANWFIDSQYERVTDAEGNTQTVSVWKYRGDLPGAWLEHGEWVVNDQGLLDRKKINAYMERRTVKRGFVSGVDEKGKPRGYRPDEVLTWRNKEKVCHPEFWAVPEYDGEKQNLVHWCNECAWTEFRAWREENVPQKRVGRLTLMLSDAVGEEAVPLPEKVYEQGLRIEAGIRGYRMEVKRIMQNLSEETNRESAFLAAETAMVQCLRQLSEKELLTIWATELMLANNKIREDKKAAMGHVKLAYECVAWEGSPVLAKLGVEPEEADCGYLTEDVRRRTVAFAEQLLVGNDLDGKPLFSDIHSVLSRMVHGPYGLIENSKVVIPVPERHLKETGVEFHRCRKCQAEVLAIGVGMTRKNPNQAVMNQAKALVRMVSPLLK